MLVCVCMVAHVRLHLFVSIGCVHVFAQLQYISGKASEMSASGGKATIGGFPIVDTVMENKLLRLGRAPVWYLCLLWSLSS